MKKRKKKKNRIFRQVNFVILTDNREKIKENKTRDKYFDLARELKMLWNMNVTVISFIVGALGTVGGLEELEIRGYAETIQTKALLRSVRILRRVRET